MKKVNLLLFILLIVTMLGCVSEKTDYLVYELLESGDAYSVVSYRQDAKKHTIPDEYNGLPVTELNTSAFENSQMEELYIGKNIQYMGWYVFSECLNLKKIIVDNENEYYSSTKDGILFNKDFTSLVAFPQNLKMESYIIPDTVIEINYFAFENNLHLKEVTIGNGIETIEGSCFYKAKALEKVIFHKNVKQITRYAFFGCEKLESIELPENLESIGSSAFSNCISLKTITIPLTVDSIGSNAFYGCTELTIKCLVSKRPNGWNREWNGGTKVEWTK